MSYVPSNFAKFEVFGLEIGDSWFEFEKEINYVQIVAQVEIEDVRVLSHGIELSPPSTGSWVAVSPISRYQNSIHVIREFQHEHVFCVSKVPAAENYSEFISSITY